ncbi:MAG: symmetrical bis(5'-nucleosyl)-tetraphosphatase [Magnetococcales bacterium]|nr:symmetrical bis(5'-nucleosyl)-tetraphosphatase [Magnetococcales bacterium]
MAVYAIGDVHGCLASLRQLLEVLSFSPGQDRLLFVGDLVNRGPESLECLRFVHGLGASAQVVMGNHEVNILKLFASKGSTWMEPWQKTFRGAPDCELLLDWMARFPLIIHDSDTGCHVVHAGLSPLWSLSEAMVHADRVTRMMDQLERRIDFFAPLTRHPPIKSCGREEWHKNRDTLSIFTRIRLTARDGRPVWPEEARKAGMIDPYAPPPDGFSIQPWYRVRYWEAGETVVYGHWAAIGLALHDHSKGLDSGCVYGGHLTAIRLDDPAFPITGIPCPCYARCDSTEG